MASAGAASAVHLENAVQPNLPITTNSTSVPEIQRHMAGYYYARKAQSSELLFSSSGLPEIALTDNPVSQALAFNKDGSSIN